MNLQEATDYRDEYPEDREDYRYYQDIIDAMEGCKNDDAIHEDDISQYFENMLADLYGQDAFDFYYTYLDWDRVTDSLLKDYEHVHDWYIRK